MLGRQDVLYPSSWARYSHQNKPPSWITSRYYGMFNQARKDRWVFGDRDSGAALRKFSWTRIVPHQMSRAPRHLTIRP